MREGGNLSVSGESGFGLEEPAVEEERDGVVDAGYCCRVWFSGLLPEEGQHVAFSRFCMMAGDVGWFEGAVKGA